MFNCKIFFFQRTMIHCDANVSEGLKWENNTGNDWLSESIPANKYVSLYFNPFS